MFPWLSVKLESSSETVIVFAISLAAVGAAAVFQQPALAWLALGGCSGFVVRWVLDARGRIGDGLTGLGVFMALLVGLYCMIMVLRALELMG